MGNRECHDIGTNGKLQLIVEDRECADGVHWNAVIMEEGRCISDAFYGACTAPGAAWKKSTKEEAIEAAKQSFREFCADVNEALQSLGNV